MALRIEGVDLIAAEMARLNANLEKIIEILIPPQASEVVFFDVSSGSKRKVDKMFMKIDEKATLAVGFKDRRGNDAKVDGVPAWSSTDDSMGALTAATDGLSAEFVPAKVGTVTLQVKADSDLGAGVTEIIGELVLEVSALEAVKVEIGATVGPQ